MAILRNKFETFEVFGDYTLPLEAVRAERDKFFEARPAALAKLSTDPKLLVELRYLDAEPKVSYESFLDKDWFEAFAPQPNSGPKSLLFYYGFPISYENLNDVGKIIDRISSTYDIWVVGDGYQDPLHGTYDTTSQILAGCQAKGVRIYGYVPIGVLTDNRPLPVLQKMIDEWDDLNVDGIFFDEFGFDFLNSRQRQIDVVAMARLKNLPYCANSFTWGDFAFDTKQQALDAYLGNVNDFRYQLYLAGNPTELPLDRKSTDSTLMESWGAGFLGMATQFDTLGRLVFDNMHNPENIRLWGNAAFAENPAGTYDVAATPEFASAEDLNKYLWALAQASDIYAFGANGFTYGASGSTTFHLPKWDLPTPFRLAAPETPDFNPAVTIVDRIYGKNTIKVQFNDGGVYDFSSPDNVLDDVFVPTSGEIPTLDKGQVITFNVIGNLPDISDILIFKNGLSYRHVGSARTVLSVKATQGVSDTTTQGTITFKVNNVAKSSAATFSATAGTLVDVQLLAPTTIAEGDTIDFSFVDGGTGDAQHIQVSMVISP